MSGARVAVLVLFSLLPALGWAQPGDTAVLKHIYGDGVANGFSDFRGKAYQDDPNVWHSVTCPPGADDCWIDWTSKLAKFVMSCSPSSYTTFDAAQRDYKRWIALVQEAFPKLTPIYAARGTPDNERTFFDQASTDKNGDNNGPIIEVKIEQDDKTSLYDLFVVIKSSLTGEQAKQAALGAAKTLEGFVSEDVAKYLEAARTQFKSMKAGAMRVQGQDGLRSWDATWKPFFAKSCEVQEVSGTTSVLCVLYRSPYEGEIVIKARELISAISKALPSSWSEEEKPPFTDVVSSVGYTSTSGASGQVWIKKVSEGDYTLSYRVTAAPAK